MKKAEWIMFIFFVISLTSSCQKGDYLFEAGDICIEIETGENWIHDFPLLPGINKKNPPQFSVWIEDTAGNYLATVFVTYTIATESWIGSKGNRRKEALPHWCYKRGVVYPDGLMLPTKDNPLTDGITGATPKSNKVLQVRLFNFDRPVIIKAEFNHSLDFNDFFPESAAEGSDNYSGGKMGSGQPAIIYAATLYPLDSELALIPIGRSSSNGSDGNIYTDLEKLSTAKSIVKQVKVKIIK